MFDCRTCWSACSAGNGDAVEVIGRKGPSEMPVQMKRSFHLVEGAHDGRVAGVAPLVTDDCTLVVVHASLDARGVETVPGNSNSIE